MAGINYNWNTLYDGQSVSLNLTGGDTVQFGLAHDYDFDDNGSLLLASEPEMEKYVSFTNFNWKQVTSTNVLFSDTTLFFGDNSLGTTDDDLAQSLTGTAGSDVFNGFGGNDTLSGGDGNDFFVLAKNAGKDSIMGGNGIDTVWYDEGNSGAAVNLITGLGHYFGEDLATQQDVLLGIENVGTGGYNDLITGNGLNNVLIAEGGNDTVLGADGNDVLDGDWGNDSLNGGNGVDTLAGGEGNDTLIGGPGNDVLSGGRGNDIYYAEAGDIVSEVSWDVAQGDWNNYDYIYSSPGDLTNYDTVRTNSTFSLTAPFNPSSYAQWGIEMIERLELLGTANISGTGNQGNNVIVGNAGHNSLRGMSGNDSLIGGAGNDVLMGGAGNDTLTGGIGNDTFRFNSNPFEQNHLAPAPAVLDEITDFSNVLGNNDTIQLSRQWFNVGPIGTLAAGAFKFSSFGVGGVTLDADDRIIYNTTSGQLYYDADGSGAAAAVNFATITAATKPALTNADFFVI